MTAILQKTLGTAVAIQGTGLHSGAPVELRIRPAPTGTGIRFIRTDLEGRPSLAASVKTVRESPRCTRLVQDSMEILTPEHLLSACVGMGITNLEVELSAAEVPILDGSAAPFCRLFAEAGVVVQSEPISPLSLRRPVFVEEGSSFIVARPASSLHITYVASYPHHVVGTQFFEYDGGQADYATEVAPARTFGFWEEIGALRARGLALGGSLDCALVVMPDGYSSSLRFENEIVRHKTLDLLGDLALLGRPLHAHLVAVRTSHRMHARLLSELLAASEENRP